jgi:hypothetical protein
LNRARRLAVFCALAKTCRHPPVEFEQPLAQSDVGVAVREVTVWRARELVCGAVLVDHPRHLIGVPREVGREACRDQEIDRLAVARREIEQTPRRGLGEQIRLRLGAEWDRDLLDRMAALTELVDERLDVPLRAAADERDLGFGDHDAP